MIYEGFAGLDELYEKTKTKGNLLHIVGILGNTKEDIAELEGMVTNAKKGGVKRIAVHGITHVKNDSGTPILPSLRDFDLFLLRAGGAKVASLAGSFYAVDGDGNTDRISKVFETITKGNGNISDEGTVAYVQQGNHLGIADLCILPALFAMEHEQPILVQESSVVLFCDFGMNTMSLLENMLKNYVDKAGYFLRV